MKNLSEKLTARTMPNRKANCKDYAEFVIFLYDIGALACKESEMERIVEALDEIDSGREY